MMDAKYQLARALQRTGHDSDAVPLLRQVVKAEPRNSEAGASLGLALLLGGTRRMPFRFLSIPSKKNRATLRHMKIWPRLICK